MNKVHFIIKLLVTLLLLNSNLAFSAEQKADDILGFWLLAFGFPRVKEGLLKSTVTKIYTKGRLSG